VRTIRAARKRLSDLLETAQQWTQRKAEQFEVTREMLASLRNEIGVATGALRVPGLR
jgi:hypothetical protein